MRERRSLFVNNVYLLMGVFFFVTIALIYTKSILIPFTISLFIYAILSSATYRMRTHFGLGPALALVATLFVFLVVVAGLVVLIADSFESLFSSADTYQDRLLGFVQWWADFVGRFGVELNAASIKSELARIPVFQLTRNFTGGVLALLGNAVLIVIFVIFLLIGGAEELGRHPLVREIHFKISRYLTTKFVLSLVTACLVWIVLLLFGVELASTFAVLTFLFNFIPTIGSIIATLLPLPIVLLQFGPGGAFFSVFVLSILIQFSIGSILEPKIMGENFDLHPIAVLIFLMFWGLVWGIPGMFLAVPMTAVKKIIFSRIEVTKPLAELLAGRLAPLEQKSG